MNIILTEKVSNLGNLGDIVHVKPGYARNYLLPQGKAIRATKENIEIFEKERSKREEDNIKNKSEAEKQSKELKDISLIILRPASETGLLYGSVSTRDISKLLKEKRNHRFLKFLVCISVWFFHGCLNLFECSGKTPVAIMK